MITFSKSKKKKNLFFDYCQFLLSSITNFTQTYFGDHSEKWNHDQLNRFLINENIPSRELWESVKNDIEYDNGYIVFDDVVVQKSHAKEIEVLRNQWSGSDKKVVLGIGIVTCIYITQRHTVRTYASTQ